MRGDGTHQTGVWRVGGRTPHQFRAEIDRLQEELATARWRPNVDQLQEELATARAQVQDLETRLQLITNSLHSANEVVADLIDRATDLTQFAVTTVLAQAREGMLREALTRSQVPTPPLTPLARTGPPPATPLARTGPPPAARSRSRGRGRLPASTANETVLLLRGEGKASNASGGCGRGSFAEASCG